MTTTQRTFVETHTAGPETPDSAVVPTPSGPGIAADAGLADPARPPVELASPAWRPGPATIVTTP